MVQVEMQITWLSGCHGAAPIHFRRSNQMPGSEKTDNVVQVPKTIYPPSRDELEMVRRCINSTYYF